MSTDATTFPLPSAPLARSLWLERVRAVRRWLQQPAVQARAGLGAVLVSTAFIVVAAVGRPSFLSAPTQAHYFPGWMAGPLGGIWPALTGAASLRWLVTGAVVLAFVGYLLAIRHARHVGIRTIAVVVVAAQVLLWLAPPLALTDVFNYLNYARMEVVHHLNPYTTIPQLEPHSDRAFALSNWHGLLSPYGPLFTIFTFVFAWMSLAVYFWTFKTAILLCELGIVFLTWRCAKLLAERPWGSLRSVPIDPKAAVVMVGLNPIVLIWGLGGDHNDFFTVLCVLLGFYLLLKARAAEALGRPAGTAGAGGTVRPAGTAPPPGTSRSAGTGTLADTAGAAGTVRLAGLGLWAKRGLAPGVALEMGAGAAFVAAAGLKASAGLLIPIVLVSLLGLRRRLFAVVAGMALAGVIAAAATLVAFGVHFPNLTLQNSLVTALSIPNLIGLALAQGGETGVLHDVLNLALVASLVACCVLGWRRREPLSGAGWAMVAVLVTLSWVLPWYVVWVLPMAALSGSRRLRMAVVALSVYFILAWAPASSGVMGSLGFHPQHTAVGRQHTQAVDELLY